MCSFELSRGAPWLGSSNVFGNSPGSVNPGAMPRGFNGHDTYED